MHSYIPTERGSEMVEESGLRAMTDRLLADDKLDAITEGVLNISTFYFDEDEEEDASENYLETRVTNAWHMLPESERAVFHRAMAFDESANWIHLGKSPVNALFSLPGEVFEPSTEEDRLVLSGLIGFQYRNYRNRCKLLARSGYADYGFTSYVDSAAFVGAYILGRAISEEDKGSRTDKVPTLTYVDEGIKHALRVGADHNGDFRMADHMHIPQSKNIISPSRRPVEFSALKGSMVGGYHSVEPSIALSMFEYVLLTEGREALKTFTDECTAELVALANGTDRIDYTIGNFADYGSARVDDDVIKLQWLMEDPEYRELRTDSPILESLLHTPQSAMQLEILQAENGIILQNRWHGKKDFEDQISIPRHVFTKFFKSLVQQAQAGLGRTAPAQHIMLVKGVRELLN